MVHEVGFRGCSAQSGLRFIALLIFQVSLDLLFSDRRQSPMERFRTSGFGDPLTVWQIEKNCLEGLHILLKSLGRPM